MDRLEKQINFILEIDKLKQITRQTYLSNGIRKENDAEHSWHLAMMCLLLAEYSNEPINMAKTLSMVLVHDLVEIDAGDTYAYDELANLTKRDREEAAANRIFQLLPEDQASYFRDIWEEFECYKTPEARFAHAMDNFQPLLLNHITDGKGWREHNVTEDAPRKRNERTGEGSKVIAEEIERIIRENVELGHLIAVPK